MSLWKKIAKNVALPIFCQTYYINFDLQKSGPNTLATSVVFIKLPNVKNRPRGENSPNLVTLLLGRRDERTVIERWLDQLTMSITCTLAKKSFRLVCQKTFYYKWFYYRWFLNGAYVWGQRAILNFTPGPPGANFTRPRDELGPQGCNLSPRDNVHPLVHPLGWTLSNV
jgi:hypothetical protein